MDLSGGDNVVGLGVDLVEVDRFRKVLDRTPRLAGRLFTESERRYCDSARHSSQRAQRFAVRFAAKEAAMKALGVGIGGIGWRDVEVVRAEGGAPSLRARGHAAARATELGGHRWLVSLTHTDTLAQAAVLLVR